MTFSGIGYMVFMGDGGDISRCQQSIKGEDRVKRGEGEVHSNTAYQL